MLQQEISQVRTYASQCLKAEAQALLDLIPQLDDHFDRAVDMIFHCKGKVIVTGVGKSGNIGAKIAATLSSTGTPAFFINPLDVYHGDLGVMTPDDVVLALSNSGQTDELLRFLPMVLHMQVPLIGMSRNPRSLLAKYSNAHITVKVEKEACPLNLAPTSSTTAALAMGDALAVALIKARNFQPADFAKFHPGGSLGRGLLCRVKDEMQTRLPLAELTTSFADCLTVMNEGRMGVALVMENGQLKGIITDGDIRRALAANGANTLNKTAQDLMTSNPKTIHYNAYLSEAEAFMKEKKIHSLIAVDDDNNVVGLIEFSS